MSSAAERAVGGVPAPVTWKGVFLSLAPPFCLLFLAGMVEQLSATRPFQRAISAVERADFGQNPQEIVSQINFPSFKLWVLGI